MWAGAYVCATARRCSIFQKERRPSSLPSFRLPALASASRGLFCRRVGYGCVLPISSLLFTCCSKASLQARLFHFSSPHLLEYNSAAGRRRAISISNPDFLLLSVLPPSRGCPLALLEELCLLSTVRPPLGALPFLSVIHFPPLPHPRRPRRHFPLPALLHVAPSRRQCVRMVEWLASSTARTTG